MIKRMFIFCLACSHYILFGNVNSLQQLDYELNLLVNSVSNLPSINNVMMNNVMALNLVNEAIASVGLSQELAADYRSGYCFIEGFITKGIRTDRKISNLVSDLNAGSSLDFIESLKHQLANDYKIHLMPRSMNDLKEILIRFFKQLKINPKLQDALYALKFKFNVHFGSEDQLKESIKKVSKSDIVYLPIVVFFPNGTKEDAEYVLNTIIKLYPDIQGADIAPRYNKKVNNLIYYAQGDGDYKSDLYKSYYTDDRVFYRKDFEGVDKDYSLKIDPEFKL